MRKMKKILALALAVAVVGVTMTGCGKPAATDTKPAATDTKPQATDTLIYAQGAEPRGLDPALVDDGESAKVMINIYDGLLQYNKDSTKVEPSLAKSWEVSPDGLSYTFHLQEGVKFHDGTDFNAEAVKVNIDRQIPPLVTADMAYGSFVYGSVKDVQVVDKNTVKVNLTAPSTPFLANLAMVMSAPIVSPKALTDSKNNVNQAPGRPLPKLFKVTSLKSALLSRSIPMTGQHIRKKLKQAIMILPSTAGLGITEIQITLCICYLTKTPP